MARKTRKAPASKNAQTSAPPAAGRLTRVALWIRRWLWRAVLGFLGALLLSTLLYSVLNPPTTPYMLAEGRRHGEVDQQWVPLTDIAPVMARAVVAAEDANFCAHFGFDIRAIRAALAEGGSRGASTLTQQVVKNTYLWHGRSWLRKALEAGMTPMVELFWSKRRILEVYLNIAEFGTGIFGVEAAARHYFGVGPDALSPAQAAALAAVLPNPKARNPARLTKSLRRRAARIADGAATIRADGRAACFED